MWDGFFLLLLLCLFMAGISYFVGSLPLSLTLSSRQLRLVTALGTGVLVGTSLIVIIPEGIETLYSSPQNNADLQMHGRTRSIGIAAREDAGIDLLVPRASQAQEIWRREAVTQSPEVVPSIAIASAASPALSGRDVRETGAFTMAPPEAESDRSDSEDGADDDDDDDEDKDDDTEEEKGNEGDAHNKSHDPHSWVGLSLISGFILMYLIDTLPKQTTPSSRPQRFSISLRQFSLHRNSISTAPESDTASMNGDYQSSSSRDHNKPQTSRPSSTTTGLVIHAIADGIALGASSSTTARLSFIIFLAIIIHKAPAAFGLTSVLLKQNLSKRQARAHLIVFSLAAPLGAMLTFALSHLLGVASALESGGNTEFATGVLLLFSAGTFLYVAMHTMQEQGGGGGGDDGHGHGGNGYVAVPASIYGEQISGSSREKEDSRGLETVVTVAGMLVPLVTQIGHAH